MTEQKLFLSGMRPVAEFSLKHLLVANEWVKKQNDYFCFFSIDDVLALTSDHSGEIPDKTLKTVKELLICGIDPGNCVIFNQSLVPQSAQMLQILIAILPAKLFLRNPVYKKKLANGEQPSLGVLAAPLYELVDVLLYKTEYISTSLYSTVEIIRDAMRKLNKLGMFESGKMELPQMLVSPIPDIVGIDGTRVDPQKKNYFSPNDSMDELRRKVLSMPTRFSNKLRQGRCVVAEYLNFFKIPIIKEDCDVCFWNLTKALHNAFAGYRENKEKFKLTDEDVKKLFLAGVGNARHAASKSLFEYMQALKLLYKE